MPWKKKLWNDLGYMGKHKRIWTRLGKAFHCEDSFCNKKSKTFGWANISGKYEESTTDWKQLCMSCHKKFDFKKRNPNGMSDKNQRQIIINGLLRIRDEINFIIASASIK